MKSRGLGDDIEKLTRTTGIKAIVEIVTNSLNIPCGCSGRQEQLNQLVSYKRRNAKRSKKEVQGH